MIFEECPLSGAWVIDVERHADERGFFARSYCAEEFAAHGADVDLRQCSVSFNARQGTLRGMHYQIAPQEEHKLVRCTAGSIFDVIVDIRSASPTFKKWFGVELTAENRRSMLIPPGFAHGFVSLCDETEVYYMISASHVPELSRGIRWNDPAIGIEWPCAPTVVSRRDTEFPLFDAGARGG